MKDTDKCALQRQDILYYRAYLFGHLHNWTKTMWVTYNFHRFTHVVWWGMTCVSIKSARFEVSGCSLLSSLCKNGGKELVWETSLGFNISIKSIVCTYFWCKQYSISHTLQDKWWDKTSCIMFLKLPSQVDNWEPLNWIVFQFSVNSCFFILLY